MNLLSVTEGSQKREKKISSHTYMWDRTRMAQVTLFAKEEGRERYRDQNDGAKGEEEM